MHIDTNNIGVFLMCLYKEHVYEWTTAPPIPLEELIGDGYEDTAKYLRKLGMIEDDSDLFNKWALTTKGYDHVVATLNQ